MSGISHMERYCPVVGHNVAFSTENDGSSPARCVCERECTEKRGGCKNKWVASVHTDEQ